LGYNLSGKRVWVTGHRGMVGSAVLRALARRGDLEPLTATHAALDLRDRDAVWRWMAQSRPQAVFAIAARLGGIMAHAAMPADFLYDNLMMQANVIHAAHSFGVEKLVFIGSSSAYPKLAAQPLREDSLLTGALEPADEWYAIAKIAGVKLCQAYRRQYGSDFICAMPANVYGPHDNFDLRSGHALPVILRRFHEATERGADAVTLWGTGRPRREFTHADDLADALIFLMQAYSDAAPINVGAGVDTEIRELAAIMREVTGFRGGIVYDTGKPDGPARKLLDSSRLRALGWTPKIALRDGVASLYRWYLENLASVRGAGCAGG